MRTVVLRILNSALVKENVETIASMRRIAMFSPQFLQRSLVDAENDVYNIRIICGD